MNKRDCPKEEAADKLKYRLTVKMATSDYYTLKGKARSVGNIRRGVLARVHEK